MVYEENEFIEDLREKKKLTRIDVPRDDLNNIGLLEEFSKEEFSKLINFQIYDVR